MQLTNAKGELLGFLLRECMPEVLCIRIMYEDDMSEDAYNIRLKVGYTPEEFEKFLSKLNFNYNNGFGMQCMYGEIWFKDGTWATRCEYDGSECWQYHRRPEVPSELIF
jgi:hypothetical protein